MADTLDDLKKKLAEAGIPLGTWSAPGSSRREVDPFGRVRTILEGIEGALSKQVEADVKKVSDLQARLEKLKSGGVG